MLLLLLVNILKYTLQTEAAIPHSVLILLDYVEIEWALILMNTKNLNQELF